MEQPTAANALSALGHEPRLEVFRLLVKAGPQGIAAGEIGRMTGIRQNTLSSNLSVLANAGLVESRREGRSIIYSAAYTRIADLLGFLVEDCCGGDPAINAPWFPTLPACCGPTGT